MAAQQPPNWVAFRAASGRVNQSANQLVEALQASSNIPTDLAQMSSELEQLEYQPTNAVLQQQMQQQTQQFQQQMQQFQQQIQQQTQQIKQQIIVRDQNMTARLLNSNLQNEGDQLFPLFNPETSAPIVPFPATSAALASLSWAERKTLGISLGISDPGAPASAAVRLNFFRELRRTIGLRPRPA